MSGYVIQHSDLSPLKVERLENQLKSGGGLTPVEKLMIYQALSRYWRQYLTPSEFVTLSYIVDRSAGWGKPYFTASAYNVLYGNDEYSGVGLGRTAYYQTLKTLEAKGAIRRKGMRDRTRIWLNLNWCHHS